MARAGTTARSVVHDGLSHSTVCKKRVTKANPHCYPSVRSGVIHFTSGSDRRVFLRPRNRSDRLICPGNVSASLPRRIRLRCIHDVHKLRTTRVTRPNCTIRCSCVSPQTLHPALRAETITNLCLTNRVGKAANCRRTTTRKLITNLGTTHETANTPRIVFDHARDCVKIVVSSLVDQKIARPCQVFASHTRFELSLQVSGTSHHLAPGKLRLKYIKDRHTS